MTQAEYDHLVYTDRLKRDVIKVDDFEHDLSRAGRQEDAWQSPDKKRALVTSM